MEIRTQEQAERKIIVDTNEFAKVEAISNESTIVGTSTDVVIKYIELVLAMI